MPEAFNLEGFQDPVEVTLTDDIGEEDLLGFKAFRTWRDALQSSLALQYSNKEHAFHDDPFTLQKVEVQSVDWFTKEKLGFVKVKATLRNSKGTTLPGIAFLRGGSVAMLMILRPKDSRDERLVVLTEQPRVPAGSLSFLEIPAGMIDDSSNFAGAAAKEIEEETGFKLPKSELIDLTELALERSELAEKPLQDAMYPSPGGSDEFVRSPRYKMDFRLPLAARRDLCCSVQAIHSIPIFLWEKELDRQEIEDLRGKLTGQLSQGEMIRLRVVNYEYLWREGARDGKTLAAWALYEGLNRAGLIQKERERRKHSRESGLPVD